MLETKTVSTITIGDNNFYEGDLIKVGYIKDDEEFSSIGQLSKIRRNSIVLDASAQFNSNIIEIQNENVLSITKYTKEGHDD